MPAKPWLIVQYDDRPLDPVDLQLIERNQIYARKHGYEHMLITSGYIDLPPYWRKVKVVMDLMGSGKYKGILWMDTDAVVANMDITLDSIQDMSKDFYKAINVGGNQIFNAGVWLVRDTARGLQIMKDWMGKYNAEDWRLVDGTWHTRGAWAGKTYEQGSFAYTVVPKHKKGIETVPVEMFQSTDLKNPDVFIYHFYAGHKHKRAKFLRKHPLSAIAGGAAGALATE